MDAVVLNRATATLQDAGLRRRFEGSPPRGLYVWKLLVLLLVILYFLIRYSYSINLIL